MTDPSTSRTLEVETYGNWVATVTIDAPIGLSGTGQMPASASDGTRELLFDGVLGNAEELRRELGQGNGSASTAQLVLEGVRRDGVRATLRRLRGTWAVVMCDRGSGEIVCARDHFGLYGLFYAESNGKLLLSPSVEALAQHPAVPREVNRAALAEFLSHRWLRIDETYYEAVKRVPPGRILSSRGSRPTSERYWEQGEQGEGTIRDPEEAFARFDAALEQAVARCLSAPTAAYLSGGFDSVTVTALATDLTTRLGEQAPHALSLVFEYEGANEEDVQRSVAEQLGLGQTILPVSQAVPEEGLLEAAMKMSAERPAPMLNIWNPAYRYLTLDGKKRGRTVILTGNGGDEWLEYPIYRAEALIERGGFRDLYRVWEAQRRSYPVSTWRITRNLVWTYGTAPILRRAAGRVLRRIAPGVVTARRRRMVDRPMQSWIGSDPALRAELHRRFDAFAADVPTVLDSPLVAVEMEEFFESGRMNGARLAHPFWDPDLTTLLDRISPELMISGGRSKALVRRSLAQRFPDLGFERHRKLTAVNFYRSLIMAEAQRAWRRLGGAKALVELGIADRDKVERHMQRLFAGGAPMDYYWIWYVLTTESWARARV